jgi:DNA-binding transcriptional LysR family regulator
MEVRMDWDKLRAFHAAAEAGSFTDGGALVNLSQSAISRQVTALECDLKTSLFYRHARGLRLTEQGEFLHGVVRELVVRVSRAESRLAEFRDHPGGTLRISTDIAFGVFWLTPRLNKFYDLYPEIALVLMFDGGDADLAMGEADVAICMSPPQKSSVIQRRILRTRFAAFAAPEYLRRHGTPQSPADLGHHRLVVLRANGKRRDAACNWLLEISGADASSRPPVARFDDIQGLYRAVAGGLGIGALPHFTMPEGAGMARVLPGFASPIVDGYFVYAAELRTSKRISVFRDFLLREIGRVQLNLEPWRDAQLAPDPDGTTRPDAVHRSCPHAAELRLRD